MATNYAVSAVFRSPVFPQLVYEFSVENRLKTTSNASVTRLHNRSWSTVSLYTEWSASAQVLAAAATDEQQRWQPSSFSRDIYTRTASFRMQQQLHGRLARSHRSARRFHSTAKWCYRDAWKQGHKFTTFRKCNKISRVARYGRQTGRRSAIPR